jgi:putative glutamine amidotransferase
MKRRLSVRPIVGLPADRVRHQHHYYHQVGEKYLAPVTEVIGGIPWSIPALGERLDLDFLLDGVDGLLLTGSYSHIEPHRYGTSARVRRCLYDPERDEICLTLIPMALEKGIPILGICRGLQELNVALGGTLHQQVHQVPGLADHRSDASSSVEAQYSPAHTLHLAPEGLLAKLAGHQDQWVNSLHDQGIDRLGDGLSVEAVAPDGLIEAVHAKDARNLTLAVQWHPEWRYQENPFHLALFDAFGKACRARASKRLPDY